MAYWRNGRRPIILSQSGIPVGIPSSGSIGNNGALSGLTALDKTYSGGLYLYFPANAIFTGSAAGLYWTVMSSTTAGTIYNNTYTGGTPAAPASPTAFATTGPGAYTQSTSEITLRTVTIPGGMMGPNGILRVRKIFMNNTTVGSKTESLKLGGSTVFSFVSSTNNGLNIDRAVANQGVANAQVTVPITLLGPVSVAAALVETAIDTAADASLTTTAQLATATDWVISRTFEATVNPS